MTFLWWQIGVWYCSSDSWVHLWPAFPAYFIRLSSLSFSYFSYEEAPTCKVKKDKHGKQEVLISWASADLSRDPGTHHQAFTLTNTDMTQASSPPPSLLCCLLPAWAFVHAIWLTVLRNHTLFSHTLWHSRLLYFLISKSLEQWPLPPLYKRKVALRLILGFHCLLLLCLQGFQLLCVQCHLKDCGKDYQEKFPDTLQRGRPWTNKNK